MNTFAERKAALETLGWGFSLEEERREIPGEQGWDYYPVELFKQIRLPLTPNDWCRLCMRDGESYLSVETEEGTSYESSEYIGGCCGNMSAVQDRLNEWFRDGGTVEVLEFVDLGDAMRDHGDEAFDSVTPEELGQRVEKMARAIESSEESYVPAWEKLALLYLLVKDHYQPKVPRARRLDQNEVQTALSTVASLSWAFGMSELFRDRPTTHTTEQAQKTMRLHRFLPAFKVLHEHARELVPEAMEGWAIVDLEVGEGEVAENRHGYCIYATKPEAERILTLTKEAQERYEQSPKSLEHSFKIRAVRVSIDKGIEFLDEGEDPKPKTPRRPRASWLRENVEDPGMLFEQYAQGRYALREKDGGLKKDLVVTEAREAWFEAARFFGPPK